MEDSSFQTPINQFSYSSETPKKPKKFVYFIIFILIVGGFFLVRNLLPGSKTQSPPPEITPTPTEYQFPTDTPVPSVTPAEEKAETTITPTTKAVNPVDQSSGLDRSTLKIEVQNGSGEVGIAGKGADVLKALGYGISSTGNADNYDYQGVTVKVKSTKANFLPLLKKDLGFSYTVESATSDLSSDSTADALVIIGK
jgi:hypothetical protein